MNIKKKGLAWGQRGVGTCRASRPGPCCAAPKRTTSSSSSLSSVSDSAAGSARSSAGFARLALGPAEPFFLLALARRFGAALRGPGKEGNTVRDSAACRVWGREEGGTHVFFAVAAFFLAGAFADDRRRLSPEDAA